MVPRSLSAPIRLASTRYPVVTITGPRQSGKTTVCRALFAELPYVSLEAPDTRAWAAEDPREFLASHRDGAVLDEVQRVPELLSYLQAMVDADPTPGRFILTGSQNLLLSESVSQSLAGRTAVLHLLPCSHRETLGFPGAPEELLPAIWTGGYPAIHDRGIPANDWLENYVQTYVERDVRQLMRVADLVRFQTFVEMCAGRAGQLVNFSELGAAVGITHNTASAWLSVLETSFLLFRLRPYFQNLEKRLVRTPKLYFYDTGLLCALLRIRTPEELTRHPLRGAIFENWVVAEALKTLTHAGERPRLHMLRDRRGAEIDLLVERDEGWLAIETKSGTTLARDAARHLDRFAPLLEEALGVPVDRAVVYGGETRQRRREYTAVPWNDIASLVGAESGSLRR